MQEVLDKAWKESSETLSHVIAQLPTVLVALLVFAAFVVAAKVSKRSVGKAVRDKTGDATTAVAVGRIISLGLTLLGALVAASIAFPKFSLDSLVATLGLTSIAVGFAFKDIFENFFAGFVILLSRPFKIGDVVRAQGVVGKIEEIGVRSISLRKFDGELVLIPSVKVFGDVVTVVTDRPVRRFEFVVRLDPHADLSAAAAGLKEAVEGVSGVEQDQPVVVVGTRFAENAVEATVYYWIDTATADLFQVQAGVMAAVQSRLSSEGAFPPVAVVTARPNN